MTTQNQAPLLEYDDTFQPNVTFLGTAGAFNTGGRANSCYLVQDSLGSYTVDFGPTALMKAQEYGRSLNDVDVIYVTHLHGDHIAGFPILFLHLQFDLNRTKPLIIAGPPSTELFVNKLRASTYPSAMNRKLSFDIRYETWLPNQSIEIGQRRIFSIEAIHDEQAEPHSIRIEGPNYTLAFSGDTGWQTNLAELAKDTDMFICEATADQAGYWGHLSVEEHRRYRTQLTPKQLVLSHLSQTAMLAAEADAENYNWIVASDGLRLPIKGS